MNRNAQIHPTVTKKISQRSTIVPPSAVAFVRSSDTRMSFFLKFSKYHLLSFFQEWLALEDVCKLDTAYCHTKQRLIYLNFISSTVIKLHRENDIFVPDSIIDWLPLRNVQTDRIPSISIHNNDLDRLLAKEQLDVSQIRSICIGNIWKENIPKLHKFLNTLTCLDGIQIKESEYSRKLNNLNEILAHCPMLTSCDFFSLVNMTSDFIIKLAVKKKQITHFNLAFCLTITDDAILVVVKSCDTLSYINLSNCARLTNKSITFLADCTHNLTSVNISCINGVTEVALISLVEKCKLITALYMNQLNEVSNEVLKKVAESLPDIRTLHFHACVRVTDVGISAIGRGCLQITDLGINSLPRLTVAAFTTILNTMPALQKIEFFLATEHNYISIMERICKKFETIFKLDLQACIVEGSCVKNLVQYITPVSANGAVDIGGVGSEDRMGDMENPFLLSILPKCSQLTDLLVRTKPMQKLKISLFDLQLFISHCTDIRSLNLAGLKNVYFDEQLSTIAQYIDQLRELRITCYRLTDRAAVLLIHNNCHLRVIDCAGCKELTDATLLAVAECCRQVKYIDFSFCTRITDTSVLYLVENCPHIHTLILESCTLVTDAVVDAVTEHCRHILLLKLSFGVVDFHGEHLKTTELSWWEKVKRGCWFGKGN